MLIQEVYPEFPYRSSSEGVGQELLHSTGGKFNALLYSEGVTQWLLSQPAPPGFPAGILLPMISAGTGFPE